MSDSTPRRCRREAPCARAADLGFADLLPAERTDDARRAEGVNWRHKVLTPAVTVWAFLAQVLHPDRSCRAAAARVLAWLVGTERRPRRPTTGAYCKARAARRGRAPAPGA